MIVTLDEAARIAADARRDGKRVVTTNGCFDILHAGHAHYLAEAKKLGSILIVGVNSDRSPYFKTKPGRPIIQEQDRAQLVDALKPVDYVFLFADETPIPWIRELKPDIHVKATDASYGIEQCIERFAVEECGGRVVLLPKISNKSTTAIIEQVIAIYGKQA